MFSGIIEEIGTITQAGPTHAGQTLTFACRPPRRHEARRLDLRRRRLPDRRGDGCRPLTANVQPVTARLSTLGERRVGDQVISNEPSKPASVWAATMSRGTSTAPAGSSPVKAMGLR
ncbi:MAG: hypothetical protein R2849_14205 [Thermomicrobiales bacterium]